MKKFIIKYVEFISLIIFLYIFYGFIRTINIVDGSYFDKCIFILLEVLILIFIIFLIKIKHIRLNIKITFYSIGISIIFTMVFIIVASIQKSCFVIEHISLFIFIIHAITAVTEELLFRIYLEDQVKCNVILKCIFLSIIFSLMHDNPSFLLALSRFLLSLFLYYIFYKTKNIVAAITTHFLYNIAMIRIGGMIYMIDYVCVQFLALFTVAYIIFKIKASYDSFKYISNIQNEKIK